MNNNGKYKKPIKLIINIFILSIILISVGTYILYISNPKKITKKAINNFQKKLIDIFSTSEELNVGPNYTLASNINLNLESDYLNSTQDENIKPYKNIVSKLSQSNNILNISQDKTNKKALFSLISNKDNKEIINTKYLVENSTEYYYIKNFQSTYINAGTNNYFETLTEENTSQENINYLYDFIGKSLQSNIPDEYFEKYQTEVSISNKPTKLTKVSLALNNEKIKTIAKSILKDLKNDEKANKILTGYNEEFTNFKIKDSTKYLPKGKTLILNIYTTNLTYQIKKYELILQDDKNEQKITYETGKNKDIVYIIDNNKISYKLSIINSNNKSIIKILNSKEKNIGEISIEINKNSEELLVEIKDNNITIDIDYEKKLKNIKKNKSYDVSTYVSIKAMADNSNILNGIIKIDSKVSNEVKISEDVSNSVLESSISKDQKTGYLNSII